MIKLDDTHKKEMRSDSPAGQGRALLSAVGWPLVPLMTFARETLLKMASARDSLAVDRDINSAHQDRIRALLQTSKPENQGRTVMPALTRKEIGISLPVHRRQYQRSDRTMIGYEIFARDTFGHPD